MNAKIDLSQTYLKTKRLILRPWQEDDVEDFYEYARVEGVGEMAGWLHHQNIEESQMILTFFFIKKQPAYCNNITIRSIIPVCTSLKDSSIHFLIHLHGHIAHHSDCLHQSFRRWRI